MRAGAPRVAMHEQRPQQDSRVSGDSSECHIQAVESTGVTWDDVERQGEMAACRANPGLRVDVSKPRKPGAELGR